MNKMTKITLLGAVFALSAGQLGFEQSAQAQFKLKDVFEKKNGRININLGKLLIGLLFGSKKDATAKKSCQLDVDAQSLVDRDIYGSKYKTATGQKFYCNKFKIKGLKGDENRQFVEQFHSSFISSGETSGSGVATIVDKKNRKKEIPFSWKDGGFVQSTETVTVIDGVDVPEDIVASVPSTSFRSIKVRKGSHLNLRSGYSIKKPITGIYKGGNIVLVDAIYGFQPDRKCKSGQWAMLRNNGTGIGYVCADYLATAPRSTRISDVDTFQKPPKVFVKMSSGYTQKQVTKRQSATIFYAQVNPKKAPTEKKVVALPWGVDDKSGQARVVSRDTPMMTAVLVEGYRRSIYRKM